MIKINKLRLRNLDNFSRPELKHLIFVGVGCLGGDFAECFDFGEVADVLYKYVSVGATVDVYLGQLSGQRTHRWIFLLPFSTVSHSLFDSSLVASEDKEEVAGLSTVVSRADVLSG